MATRPPRFRWISAAKKPVPPSGRVWNALQHSRRHYSLRYSRCKALGVERARLSRARARHDPVALSYPCPALRSRGRNTRRYRWGHRAPAATARRQARWLTLAAARFKTRLGSGLSPQYPLQAHSIAALQRSLPSRRCFVAQEAASDHIFFRGPGKVAAGLSTVWYQALQRFR